MTDATNPESTFRQQVREVLPSHTHYAAGMLSWSAQWTTPDGVWSLARFGLSAVVQIEGPDFRLNAARLRAEGVISLLLDAGAIEAPAPDDGVEDRIILAASGEAVVEAFATKMRRSEQS